MLIPQLTTLGALLLIVALTNVFALNLAYDIPVKLFSFHLLLIAHFLAASDFSRLFNFLILNRPIPKAPEFPLAKRKSLHQKILVASTLIGLVCFAMIFLSRLEIFEHQNKKLLARYPFEGIWRVDKLKGSTPFSYFSANLREKIDGGSQNTPAFNSFYIGHDNLAIQFENLDVESFRLDFDKEKNVGVLSHDSDLEWKGQLTFEIINSQLLHILGNLNGVEISAHLHKESLPESKLLRRGFHLVSETPYESF